MTVFKADRDVIEEATRTIESLLEELEKESET